MTSLALHHVVEKLPFVESHKPDEARREPEIAYTDVDKDGRPTPQVLIFFTPEAFKDTKDAAQALGYTALASHLQERMDSGFQPVQADESRGDEIAREEWKNGRYDPNVFHGQTALAIRWLLEQAAGDPEHPRLPGHLLKPELKDRMAALNDTTTPVNNVKAPVHPGATEISEAVQAEGPDPSALLTTEGGVATIQAGGGLDYGAMRETDPRPLEQR